MAGRVGCAGSLGAHGTLFTERIMPYCPVWLAGSTSIHILITRHFEQLSVISVKGDSYEPLKLIYQKSITLKVL